jgi:hypothetical protein
MTRVYPLGLNEEPSQLMQDLRSTIDSRGILSVMACGC